MERSDAAAAADVERAARRTLLWGLGALWLMDGLLQLQPGMFTRALLTVVWQPVALGQPGWLATLMDTAMRIAAPRLVSFNFVIVVAQLGLGVLLFTRRPRLVRAGLWGSVGFAALLWVCAQGLGQVLTGSATLLAGAPGSVAVYGAMAVLLLLPEGSWRTPNLPAQVAGAFLLMGAVLQFSPSFWTPLGLAQPFGQAYMMPQPAGLRAAVGEIAGLAGAHPITLNAVLIAAFAAAAAASLLGRRPSLRWAVLALLGLIWVFGQDAGMLWSGMATDPNTAPALFMLVLASGRAAAARTESGTPLRRDPWAGRLTPFHREPSPRFQG